MEADADDLDFFSHVINTNVDIFQALFLRIMKADVNAIQLFLPNRVHVHVGVFQAFLPYMLSTDVYSLQDFLPHEYLDMDIF